MSPHTDVLPEFGAHGHTFIIIFGAVFLSPSFFLGLDRCDALLDLYVFRPNTTAEGDYVVLLLQTARFLTKAVESARNREPLSGLTECFQPLG